ncbi:uncharacterized protein LOC127851391 [Dreissena polymorpha]|uniref:F-box domain-containing protein n=1 Tax=Dreissena polymorpha TaxID=45954 RepID=A0A9D4D383_DREPO|nr:uncharacterized protein LOC127851391 [Dreissena polymorpha]XP_052241103.1 uncharacterized protein LOC127851391 [Dreissena polymorpha]KAH3737987.1 hypothetical protein DPMN_044588 [Dreissena polymorpha]
MTSVDVPVPRDSNLPSLSRVVRKKTIAPPPLPPPMNPEDMPWRGQGGRAPTLSSVEFDRQLDKVAMWLEEWNHEQRCQVLEGLLRRSNFRQFQFLNTSLQPALHRDFMYTARTQFPSIEFVPLSTHTSRKLKEKLIFTRQDNYHRIDSAHLTDDEQAKQQAQEKDPLRLPEITNGNPSKSAPEVPSLWSVVPSKRPRRSVSLIETQPEKWVGDGKPLYDKNPNIRYIDMPVRRHIQDEQSPRYSLQVSTISAHNTGPHVVSGQIHKASAVSGSTGQLSKSSSTSTLHAQSDGALTLQRKAKIKNKSDSSKSLEIEANMLYNWYSNNWTDVKRNEFLHKLLLKIDPRQHYFISSFLTARQYKDFITLLPETVSLKILNLLRVHDLLKCCMVCKAWNSLANNMDLWRRKCEAVKLEIPIIEAETLDWKQLYRENKFLRVNWNDGKCKITDLKGHTESVICVIFDQTRLASGGLDKSIRVWDLKTGTCMHVLKGHVKGVWCLNFYTQNLLISGSYDGTIRVWNLRTGKCQKTILAHDGPIWAIGRHKDNLVSASQDKLAKVWDINRCLLVQTLTGHSAAVFAVDMSEDGKLAITGSADKSVRIWSIETGRCLRWISVSQTTSIMSVSYSQGFLACSYGETICVYKVDGPTKLVRKYLDIVNEHQKRIECLKLQISDREKGTGIIVSAGKDGRVKYWDITKEKSLQTFIGHRGKEVNAIHFDELRIASAADDNKIRIWDFNI